MNDQVNPYQAPDSDITPADSEAESVRNAHIRHEATLKSIGLLFYLGALFGLLVGSSMLISGSSVQGAYYLGFGVAMLVIGLAQLWVGFKMRRLHSASRVPATMLSVLWLLNFPVGTVISLFIIYAINNKKGRYILSADYQDIIDATPDIKYRTSPVILFIFLVFLLLIVAAIVIPMT